jgi:hypothetical protein
MCSRCLKKRGVSINEAFFLGGISKTEVLAARMDTIKNL